MLVFGLLVIPLALGCWCFYRVYRKRGEDDSDSVDPTADQELENMATTEDKPHISEAAL